MITAVGAPEDDGDDEVLYTLADAAVLLETSVRFVFGLIRDGRLQGTRVPERHEIRVTRAALREYLERNL